MPANTGAHDRRDLAILILAIAGAGVDASVIMGFNVLTAAQTGNTILLAAAIARGQFALGITAGVSVVAYAAGAALGEWMLLRNGPPPRRLTQAFALEILLLLALIPAWHFVGNSSSLGAVSAVVAIAALAMGIQSAAVRHILPGPTTTYVTGLLTGFMTGGVKAWMARRKASGAGGSENDADGTAISYAKVWATYLCSAVAVGFLFTRVGEAALLVPVSAVAAALALSMRSAR